MKYIKWTFLFLTVFIGQIKLSTILNTPLNFLIILVYAFSLKNLPSQFKKDTYQDGIIYVKIVLFGIIIGLLEDLLSENLIGPSIFSKGMIAFLTVHFFTVLFFRWTPLLGAIFLSALTLMDNLMLYVFRILFSHTNISNLFLLKTILFQIALNLPFGIIIKGKSS